MAQRAAEADLKKGQETEAADQAVTDEVQKVLDEAIERDRLSNPPPEPEEGESYYPKYKGDSHCPGSSASTVFGR